MNLLDVTASFVRAVMPGASPAWPIATSSPASGPRRLSVAGRLLKAARWLHRTFLRSLPSKSRRLRVNETVSLGDKRFVSIVEVDGVDYLIGGGAASVALLTRLGAAAVEPGFQQAVCEAWAESETA